MNATHAVADLPSAGELMTRDTHRELHWAAIRHVCRDRSISESLRRAKLRFLIDGLARSARWKQLHPAGV